MPNPPRPTVRPGRIPVEKESDPPSSDEREKLYRELKAVEDRSKAANAELARIYERALGERDEQIRSLQNQLLSATAADGTINTSLAQLRADMAAISLSVNKAQAPEQLQQAENTARGVTRGVQLKAVLGSVLAAIVSSGIIMQIAQSCSEPTKATLPDTRPKPAGTGYAGTP